MDRPPPDPKKLLDEWMEWERGEATPGRIMANLKTAGLRDLLEQLVEAVAAARPVEVASAGATAVDATADEAAPEHEASAPVWTPTV